MVTGPTTPPEAPRDAPSGRLLLPVALYLVLFAACHYVQGYLLSTQAPRLLELIPEARRTELLGQALASKLMTQLAALSIPFLAIGLLLNWRQKADPMAGLGLSLRLPALLAAFECFTLGVVLHLAVLVILALLGTAPFLRDLAALRVLVAVAQNLVRWTQFGWIALLALPAAAFTYATARLLLPVGHLAPLLRRQLHPVLAAIAVALLVSAPYLLSPLTTPLAFLNFTLLALLLERLRANAGSLWPALGALTGWVVTGELSGLPHQAMPVEVTVPLLGRLPEILSGGRCGPEGGLITTAALLAWLALALRTAPRRATPATGEPPAAAPAPTD